MKNDTMKFLADTTFITTGTIAGFHASEIVGIIVALTNLAYVVIRLIDKYKTKK